MSSKQSTSNATPGTLNPPWLRNQIIANVQLLHPDKYDHISIMTGRTPLASTTVDDAGNTIQRYLYYANAYYLRDEIAEGGKEEPGLEPVARVLYYGKLVPGGRDEAMESLAGVVEDRVFEVLGPGGVRKKG